MWIEWLHVLYQKKETFYKVTLFEIRGRTYIPLGLVECCEQNEQLLGVPVKEMGKISRDN